MYKLLTPDFREQINRGIDRNIEELLRCDRNPYVNGAINAYQILHNMINSLPDGFPIYVEKRRSTKDDR